VSGPSAANQQRLVVALSRHLQVLRRLFGIARNKTIGLAVCVGKAAANSLIKLDWRSLLAAGSLQPGRPTRACAHVNSSEVQMKTLLLAGTTIAALAAANLAPVMAETTKPVSEVVQWNRTLLVIVRTPGGQPATIHPTRSFAIMHAAIYDAVNAIEGTHQPYLVRLGASHFASQEAAAAAAAHEVLVKLYPSSQATLDAQLQQALAQLPNRGKTDGIRIGNTVADRILALRNNDGSNAQPIPYVFGNASGDYQSTPPNFPKQPQFTHWSRVTPFALESASQFRPGGPPRLTSDRYSDAFDRVKSLGIVGSTTATADEALIGQFWNGAIQNYWNEIAQTASLAHSTTAQNARLFALLNLSFADGVIAFYDAKYTYNFWRPATAIARRLRMVTRIRRLIQLAARGWQYHPRPPTWRVMRSSARPGRRC
jgi:hypothetical protein